MKESFDALVDYLMKAGLFLEQAVEILEKSMIERALQDDRRESIGSGQDARHPSQHPAAENGGVRYRRQASRAASRSPARRAR